MDDSCHEESNANQYVIFTIDEYAFGLPVKAIDTVVRVVEITPIPGSPSFIPGAINFHGKIIPVVNLRQRFGMPMRPICVNDQLIIIHTAEYRFALIVDAVKEVMACKATMITKAADLLPNLPYLVGVARFSDGMILLNDPQKIFYPAVLEKINDPVNPVPA